MINTLLVIASLPQLITYETKAARLPVILTELSTRTGTKLECESSFKNDVLVIRVDGVDSKTLLDKIAQATVGKWGRQGDRIVLSPDVDRRKEQEAELLARRERDIQRLLDRYRRDLEGPYDRFELHAIKGRLSLEVEAQTRRPYEETLGLERRFSPLDRLAMRTVIDIGARRLAEIKPGERRVYAPNPTARQLPLPNKQSNLATFIREWNQFQEVFGSQPDTLKTTWQQFAGQARIPQHLESANHVWVSVSDMLQQPAFVTIGISTGAVRFGSAFLVASSLPQPAVIPSPELPDAKLTLEPISQALGQAIRESQNPTAVPSGLDPNLLAALLKPLERDPLSIGSELYHQYAKIRNLNLVAWLNDNSLGRGLILPAEDVTAFDRMMRPNMHFDERDGWLVLTPGSPAEARRSRDDRAAMDALMRKMTAEGRMSFDAKATYVAQRPITLAAGLGYRIGILREQSGWFYQTFGETELVLRAYGVLTDHQRQALRAGKAILFESLTPSQRPAWEQVIYGPWWAHDRYDILARSNRPDGESRREPVEPTELWPNGLPPDTALTLRIENNFLLRPSPKGNRMFLPDYDLATQMFFEQNLDLVEGDLNNWERPETFTPYDRANLQFEMSLTERLFWAGFAEDLTRLSGPVKFEGLPPKVREAINKQIEEKNRQKAAGHKSWFRIGGPGRQNPPPP